MKFGPACPGKRQAAFTFAEVLIAMFVVSIMATALYAGLSTGFSSIRTSRENLRATQVMLEKTESLRLYAWSEINSNGLLPLTFIVPFKSGGSTNGLVYSGTVTIDKPTDTAVSANYAADLRVITVKLSWISQKRPCTKTMTTYVSRWGEHGYVAN